MNPDELTSGKTGSAQNLAYRIRNGLCPITVFGICLGSEEERQLAIEQITQAANDYDASFFRKLADGLKQLKASSKPSVKKDPKYFLLRAYGFLKREKKRLPCRREAFGLAERMWAIVRVTSRLPTLPLPYFPPAQERKIRIEIDSLPPQNWNRAGKTLGLKFSLAQRGRPSQRAQN
jgi:hypothetical protein